MNKVMYLTPSVTAFKEDQTLDIASNENLFSHLYKGGMDGIVIMGSTGEFYSMSKDEKMTLIDIAANATKNKCKLFVGTGSMDINETIELSNYAIKKGAEAVMIIGQYYFSLSNESIITYFDKIANKVDGNIYLYNFPDRTGYDLNKELTYKLLENNKNIVGFKDTVNALPHTRELINYTKNDFPYFTILSGYDENLAHIALSGGDGVIGALSNLYPELFAKWVKAINTKNIDEISRIQKIVDKLMELYSISTPFIPTMKKALQQKGIISSDTCKSPLNKINNHQLKALNDILNKVEKMF